MRISLAVEMDVEVETDGKVSEALLKRALLTHLTGASFDILLKNAQQVDCHCGFNIVSCASSDVAKVSVIF